MKYAIDVGMIVRCCREYESISVGREGTVLKIMKDGGLHDLNVKVFFKLLTDLVYKIKFVLITIILFKKMVNYR